MQLVGTDYRWYLPCLILGQQRGERVDGWPGRRCEVDDLGVGPGVTRHQREREELLASMRRAEVKWATRCLCALLVLALVAAALVLGALLSFLNHRSSNSTQIIYITIFLKNATHFLTFRSHMFVSVYVDSIVMTV